MRHFELVEAGSRKFWESEVRGGSLLVRWGRLGSSGREQTKALGSQPLAEKEQARLIAEKLKKGYRETAGTQVLPAPLPQAGSSAARVEPPPQPRAFTVETVLEAGKHQGLVLGIATLGKSAIAVGGQGSDLVLYSKTGKAFSSRKSGGHGLRGALIRKSGEIVVVGEYGYAAISRDQGKSWDKITRLPRPGVKGSAPCLFAVVEDEQGTVWTAGDNGYLGRLSADGEQLEPVRAIDEYMGRIRATPQGLLLPTDPGHLFLYQGEQVTKLPINARKELMAVAMTPTGALIVVGLGGTLCRSPALGKKFVKLDAAGDAMLTGVDCLADGRILVVGAGGLILVSFDDGQSFRKVKHAGKGTLWCCRAHGEGALIGGEQGLILRYGP